MLLYLYPYDFREAYGDSMMCVFEESFYAALEQGGTRAAVVLCLRTLADLLASLASERGSRFIAALGIEQKRALGATIVLHIGVVLGMVWIGLHAAPVPHASISGVCRKARLIHSAYVREAFRRPANLHK